MVLIVNLVKSSHANTTAANRIVNGDFELGLDNWTTESGSPLLNTYTEYPLTALGYAPVDREQNYLVGGTQSSKVSQTIDISDCHADIDAGNAYYVLAGYIGTHGQTPSDDATVSATFRRGNSSSIETVQLSPIEVPEEELNKTIARYLQVEGVIPAEARSILLEVDMVKSQGFNNALVDELSFQIAPFHSSDGGQNSQTIDVLAANLTSGNPSVYNGAGTRILQGLDADVILIQEFIVGDNSTSDLDAWVNSTFGSEFSYIRESVQGGDIPNGVISRFPIIDSGEWDDPEITNREFSWARIDILGDKDLWAISVHFKSSLGSEYRRNNQANALVDYINNNIPNGDYIVLGGDLNTHSRGEDCVSTLSSIFTTNGPYPVDQSGDADTNGPRNKDYDWVLANALLDAKEVPYTIGNNSFSNGFVFDSREYTPLSDVSPVQANDSDETNMQHMAVIRRFQMSSTSLIVANTDNDTDSDYLPNNWEISHNLLPWDAGESDPNNGATGNPDNDPFTNLEEYLWGLDPQNPDNEVTLLQISRNATNGEITLTFPTVPQRRYEIWHSLDLNTWELVTNSVEVTTANPSYQWLDDHTVTSSSSSQQFYRVKVVENR